MKWLLLSGTRLPLLPLLPLLLGSLVGVAAAESLPLQLSEDAQQIAIRHGQNLVLCYNKQPPEVPPGIDPVYARSGFLHPVASPRGGVVTDAYPADHAHQSGIFGAWVNATYDGRPVDFWNLAKGAGRVLHARVDETFCTAERAGFVVELLHRAVGTTNAEETAIDVLRETWKVTCYPADGYHVFDLESVQQAITGKPLRVEEYHYGGMAIRGPTEWLLAKEPQATPVSRFLNSQGSNRSLGNHENARWVAMSGERNGRPVTIAVLSHQDNFRAPQRARLHPTKPYFCFAPCVDGAFEIDLSHPLRSRYRYLVTDHEPDAGWLDEQWKQWTRNDS